MFRSVLSKRKLFLGFFAIPCLCQSIARAHPPRSRVVVDGERSAAHGLISSFADQWDEAAWTSGNRHGEYMRPLDDNGWRVRMQRLQVLVRGGEGSVAALVETLESGDVSSRVLAAQALGYLAARAPEEPLKRALQSDSVAAVRRYAADVIGMSGRGLAGFLSQRLAEERKSDVKKHTKYALERESQGVRNEVIETLVGWNADELDTARLAWIPIAPYSPKDFGAVSSGDGLR